MKNLNKYINEAWSGVKKQSIKVEMEAWCEEMGIESYTINSKGEIDVNGGVDLSYEYFKELPYKFGRVNGFFSVYGCENLTSLKNCPDYAFGFNCSFCKNLNSIKGCPKEVNGSFGCYGCKRNFTKEEVKSLCKVKKDILI